MKPNHTDHSGIPISVSLNKTISQQGLNGAAVEGIVAWKEKSGDD